MFFNCCAFSMNGQAIYTKIVQTFSTHFVHELCSKLCNKFCTRTLQQTGLVQEVEKVLKWVKIRERALVSNEKLQKIEHVSVCVCVREKECVCVCVCVAVCVCRLHMKKEIWVKLIEIWKQRLVKGRTSQSWFQHIQWVVEVLYSYGMVQKVWMGSLGIMKVEETIFKFLWNQKPVGKEQKNSYKTGE